MKWKEKREFMYWLKTKVANTIGSGVGGGFSHGYVEFWFDNDIIKIKICWHYNDSEIMTIDFTHLNEHHRLEYFEGLSLTEKPLNEFWEKYDKTFFKLAMS